MGVTKPFEGKESGTSFFSWIKSCPSNTSTSQKFLLSKPPPPENFHCPPCGGGGGYRYNLEPHITGQIFFKC